MTNTKRINNSLLRKETSFVCYTSSVLRTSRQMKQKEKYVQLLRSKLKVTNLIPIRTPPLNTATKLFNKPDRKQPFDTLIDQKSNLARTRLLFSFSHCLFLYL